MPRRLPSSALDTQSQITAVSGSLASPQGTLSGYWKLDQKLTGDLEGNAKTATTWASNVAINGTNVNGGTTPVTIGVNTTSIATSGTYYPLFVPSNVAGNQQASTSVASGFTFDPNTKNLIVAGTVTGSNLSGTNTGDQTLPTLASLGAAPTASPNFTGTVSTQDISINRTGNDSYKLKLYSSGAEYQNYLAYRTLNWDYYRLQMSGDITLSRTFIGTNMSLASTGDLTVAGKYYGDGSQLTNLPVTSVNGQTGAVTVPSAVTSVNGDTGGVVVTRLADTFNGGGSYFNVQQMYKSISIEPSGYLGDYFGSTGLQGITGLTINNFSSAGVSDADTGAVSYAVTFSITYSNAWFETYAPGYNPSHLRMAVIRPGDLAYGTYWVGQPTTTVWNIACGQPNFVTTETLGGFPFANMTSTTTFSFTTNNAIYINGRYSPNIWPSRLKLTTYFAR